MEVMRLIQTDKTNRDDQPEQTEQDNKIDDFWTVFYHDLLMEQQETA